ncbi:hypothetical protein M0805_005993 [Coniferiporia weirii]|nr:hypothetical protein M0805_005993 [Coniferiporia weirii]
MANAEVLDLSAQSVLMAQALWYGRLCTVSSSAIIVYEHLITLSDEVRLIWHSRWSAGKVLFLISRYYNVFQVLFNTCILYSSTITARLFVSPPFSEMALSADLLALSCFVFFRCFVWLRWQAVSGILVYGVTEIILMLRLYAMYSSSKKVVALMATGFTAVIIAEIIILVFSTRAQIGPVNADPHQELSMSKCIQTDTWPLSYLYWVPFLAFETLLFALALFKGAQSVRDHELHIGLGSSRALKALEVLIRDSILYFMLIFAIYLTNVLAWTIDDGRIGEIPVSLAVAISTVMAQRLLLNIRANFEQRRVGIDGSSSGADSFQLSTMAFGGLLAEAGLNTAVNADHPAGDGQTQKSGAGANAAGKAPASHVDSAMHTESMMSGSTAVSPTTADFSYALGERVRPRVYTELGPNAAGPSSPAPVSSLSSICFSPAPTLPPVHVPPN